MFLQPRPAIVNVGYRSTNYWVIGAGGSRLLVDLGYPRAEGGAAHRDSHYHIDHAGLAQGWQQLPRGDHA